MSKSITDALEFAKVLRAERAAKAKASEVKAFADNDYSLNYDSKKRFEADKEANKRSDERSNRLELELEQMRKRVDASENARTSDASASLLSERIAYAKKSGIKVTGDTLSRILPDVDPRTTEGAIKMEKFRTENPDLYVTQAPKAADIAAEVNKRLAAKAEQSGRQQSVSQRKVFGESFVKSVLDENIGGE